MLKHAREIFLLSLAAFLLIASVAVGFGAYTVFSRRGEWVGGIVHSVLSDKGKKELDIATISEKVTEKILKKVLADDERLHVLPLIERLLDRILNRIVEKLMSNEGQLLFKSLQTSGEIDRIVLKVTDHLVVQRKEAVVDILTKVIPVNVPKLGERVVSRLVREDKAHVIEIVTRLATRFFRDPKQGSAKTILTSILDHTFTKHQGRIIEILRQVIPVDLKVITERLVKQILERNRTDVADLAQTIIVNLTKKIRQGEIEVLFGNLIKRVLTQHKRDITDLAKSLGPNDFERAIYRFADRVLKNNKTQIIEILREVLKIDLGKILAAPFQKKKQKEGKPR